MDAALFVNAHQLNVGREHGWQIIEAGFNQQVDFLTGHIPGATYLDTTLFERAPLWGLRPDAELRQGLGGAGVNRRSTCVFYSRSPLPAARLAAIALYLGIERVHLLDGGLGAWIAAGHPLESGSHRPVRGWKPDAAGPLRPEVFVGIRRLHELMHRPETLVVCVRSQAEFSGHTSGYAGISARGRIPGSIWGGGGGHKDDISHWLRPDGTLLPLSNITARWVSQGITPDRTVVFYCGTGWRASAAYLQARAAGWQSIAIYDGGWAEWSSDPRNPVETGD